MSLGAFIGNVWWLATRVVVSPIAVLRGEDDDDA